jgi:oligopeptide/dipeptide ABC transporter ATP-binding protein
MSGCRNPLLQVENIQKHYLIDTGMLTGKRTVLRAVDDVSFAIYESETFALVGESGCGKTTIAKMILGLTAITSGRIFFKSKNIADFSSSESRKIKGKIQIIFQDPYSSLNPRKTIERIIVDPLIVQKREKSARKSRLTEVLDAVGISEEYLHRYPHEFSGGQRQRIVIARALILNPELVICDEPVSALDVSIRSQILNLLKSLQDRFGITYLFISHDLSVVKYLSNRIAVMYLGKLCEIADTRDFFDQPVHPYSQALLSVIPIPDPRIAKARQKAILEGEIPSPVNPPSGCRFHTRCLFYKDICLNEEPMLSKYSNRYGRDHFCSCHFAENFL